MRRDGIRRSRAIDTGGGIGRGRGDECGGDVVPIQRVAQGSGEGRIGGAVGSRSVIGCDFECEGSFRDRQGAGGGNHGVVDQPAVGIIELRRDGVGGGRTIDTG